MQRSLAALLLCSIALVAFAAAASESAAATTKTAAAKAVIAPERAMKLLAMDSAAATAALDAESVPVATANKKKTYTRKSKKGYGHKKDPEEEDYHKESKYKSKDSYEKEHYGTEYYKPSPPPAPYGEHPEYPSHPEYKYGGGEHPKYGSGEYEHYPTEKEYEHKGYGHGKKYEEDSYGAKKKYGYGKNKYSSKEEYEHKYGKDSYGEHKSYYGKYSHNKGKYGHKEDKYGKYEEEYSHDSYGSDYGSDYESGKKVCLKETSRVPAEPTPPIDLAKPEMEYTWTSFFTCCSEVDKRHEWTAMKDTIVPDAHMINDIMHPIEPVGYCNWTMTPNVGMMEVMRSAEEMPSKPIVGMATARCEITAENDCIPFFHVGDIFETSMNPNLTLWVQVKAMLSGKPYPFAYTQEATEEDATKAVTASTKYGEEKEYEPKEVYSKNGEYAYSSYGDDEPETPTHYMPTPHKGLADHASVMIEGDKIKGGSMHYTFGFTDTNGVIKCPDINVTVTAPTEEIKGMLPVVTCGQYFLRLWGAPDHPYTDYAGYYRNPYSSYGSYGGYEHPPYGSYERPSYGYERPPYETYGERPPYETYGPGSPPSGAYPSPPPPTYPPSYDAYYNHPEYMRGPYAPAPYSGEAPYGTYPPASPPVYPSPPPPHSNYYPPGYPEEYEYPTRK